MPAHNPGDAVSLLPGVIGVRREMLLITQLSQAVLGNIPDEILNRAAALFVAHTECGPFSFAEK